MTVDKILITAMACTKSFAYNIISHNQKKPKLFTNNEHLEERKKCLPLIPPYTGFCSSLFLPYMIVFLCLFPHIYCLISIPPLFQMPIRKPMPGPQLPLRK